MRPKRRALAFRLRRDRRVVRLEDFTDEEMALIAGAEAPAVEPQPVKQMTDLDNLRTLHEHEEKLRAESIAIVNVDPNLVETLMIVANGMNLVFGFTHDYEHQTDDELTLQYLGLRLFNLAGSSIKLALSGYAQQAFSMTREILELSFLLDHFRTAPKKISAWKKASNKELRQQFSPFEVRKYINKRDGLKQDRRGEVYALLSQYASHPTYAGFALTMREGMGELGPFVQEKQLRAWLQEMGLRFVPGAAIFGEMFPNAPAALQVQRRAYEAQVIGWRQKQLSKPSAKFASEATP